MADEQNPLETLSLDRLRERTSAKWQAFDPDVLPLWVAEMDVALAPAVSEVLHRIADTGDTGYPRPDAYAEAISGFAQRHWGWEVRTHQIRPVADVMKGIVQALRLVSELADTVIVSSPVYPPFFQYPVSAGRRVVEAPLGPDGRLDFEMLEESFNLRTIGGQATYLLCNPKNPTGVVHTREELQRLAQLAKDYGIRVIADEIHAPLVLSGAEFTPYLSVDPRGYSLMSASKAFNLAGLKAAVLIAGDEVTHELADLPPESDFGASHAGVLTHSAALTHGDQWLASLLTGLESNRTLLKELLRTHLPEVTWVAPEGTYLAWLDFSAYLGEGTEATAGVETPIGSPAKDILQQASVALTPGHPFGEGGQNHARLNFATSQAVLTEAVERIGSAIRR